MSFSKFLSACLVYIVFMISFVYAQRDCRWDLPGGNSNAEQMIKTNLLNFPLKSFNLEYERSFRPQMTWAINVAYTPKRDLFFSGYFEDMAEEENDKRSIREARFSQFSIIPQARFYFGQRDNFTRFYLSPYIKYTRYMADATLHYSYLSNSNVSPVEIPMNGKINTLSVGYAIGLQFNVFRSFYLDWKIIGNHYGIVFGKAEGTSNLPLTPNIQEDIRTNIESLNDIPVYSFDHQISENSVQIKPKGLNIGFTSAFSIGYKF